MASVIITMIIPINETTVDWLYAVAITAHNSIGFHEIYLV